MKKKLFIVIIILIFLVSSFNLINVKAGGINIYPDKDPDYDEGLVFYEHIEKIEIDTSNGNAYVYSYRNQELIIVGSCTIYTIDNETNELLNLAKNDQNLLNYGELVLFCRNLTNEWIVYNVDGLLCYSFNINSSITIEYVH